MEMTKYSIRQATVSDAAIIARHRVGMFRDMNQVPTDALATKLLETSTAALGALLREHSYIGWLAIAESDRGNYCASPLGSKRVHRTGLSRYGHSAGANEHSAEVDD
jgi:hypothetical protein